MERLRSGNGEFLAAAFMSVFITSMVILIIAVMQINFSMNNLSKAIVSSSRAVAVCATKTNAEKLSLEVAQASIENQNISDIKVVLEYADSNCNKWVTGNQVIITVSAYVKTMSPFLSGERSIVHMVTIEDSDELVGNGNAEKIWNYLLSHGITPAGAAGILGNMANESSTNLDPTLFF